MAIVSDQLVSAFSRTPFVKPPDLAREWTAMPRALVNFEILDGTISAKPLNDTAELLVAIDLPVQFAYRLVSLNCALVQTDNGATGAHDWAAFSFLEITNAVRGLQGGNTQQWALTNDFVFDVPGGGGNDALEMWIARFEHVMPTDILQARDGIAAVIVFKAANQTAAATIAGSVNFLATFLEFDIEQAQRFPVHWPFMTYSRA